MCPGPQPRLPSTEEERLSHCEVDQPPDLMSPVAAMQMCSVMVTWKRQGPLRTRPTGLLVCVLFQSVFKSPTGFIWASLSVSHWPEL